MKLTIIGSMGAYATADNPSSGYLLQHDGFSLMLDFGSAVHASLQRHLDSGIPDAVYFSHYHPDHTADAGVLQHAVKVQTDLGNRSGCLPFYGMPGNAFYEKLTYHNYTNKEPVIAGETHAIGPFSCSFLENPHPDGSLCIRVECAGRSLVYTGDTGWNEKLADFAAGCDLLLCESSLFNRFKGLVQGHLTAGEVGVLASKSEVGQLLLCHFPHYGNIEELKNEAAAEFEGIINLALPQAVYNLT